MPPPAGGAPGSSSHAHPAQPRPLGSPPRVPPLPAPTSGHQRASAPPPRTPIGCGVGRQPPRSLNRRTSRLGGGAPGGAGGLRGCGDGESAPVRPLRPPPPAYRLVPSPRDEVWASGLARRTLPADWSLRPARLASGTLSGWRISSRSTDGGVAFSARGDPRCTRVARG